MKIPLNRGLRGGVAGRKIGLWSWVFVPAFVAIFATVLFAASVQPFSFYLPEPIFMYLLAFVWPLIRPSIIAPFVLAALGLFLDLFWGAPLGLWTIGLMVIYGIMTLLRTYVAAQEWPVVFGVYGAGLLVLNLLLIIFTTLDTGVVPSVLSVTSQSFATLCLFPVVLNMMERFVNTDVRFS